MSETDNDDGSGTEDPQFEVNDANDLAELLRRASNWAERDVHAETIAAELQDGADFVEDEILVDGNTAIASHTSAGAEVDAQ